jgi:hypothetical protein
MTDLLPYIKAKLASLHDLDVEDINWLVGEVERLRRHLDEVREERRHFYQQATHRRGLLARLEWVQDECPVCYAAEGTHHDPGCWLAKELRP